MKFHTLAAIALLAFSGTTPAVAEQAASMPEQPIVTHVAAAAPKDVDSIDHIIAALYGVISGPVGQARDWQRMRSLFVPGARLMAVGPRPGGGIGMRVLSVNDYVALAGGNLVKGGFHERELARRTERYGNIADIFSTYDGHLDTDGKSMRGINSIQLMNDGHRWWIVSVMWEDEHSAGMALPKRYLPTH